MRRSSKPALKRPGAAAPARARAKETALPSKPASALKPILRKPNLRRSGKRAEPAGPIPDKAPTDIFPEGPVCDCAEALFKPGLHCHFVGSHQGKPSEVACEVESRETDVTGTWLRCQPLGSPSVPLKDWVVALQHQGRQPILHVHLCPARCVPEGVEGKSGDPTFAPPCSPPCQAYKVWLQGWAMVFWVQGKLSKLQKTESRRR